MTNADNIASPLWILHKLLPVAMCLISVVALRAQNNPPHLVLHPPAKDTLYILDSFVLDGATLRLSNQKGEIGFRFLSHEPPVIILDTIQRDSFKISYRTFPLYRSKAYFLYDTNIRQQVLEPLEDMVGYQADKPASDWWDQGDLDYSGSFTRGFSVGNTQNLVLNSALNLQINGDLGHGLKLTGSISDNQIPIQPEGNTRQIQEFDRLFLKIYNNKSALTMGDFEIQKPQGYFMNYYKKSQGGLIEDKRNWKSAIWTQRAAFGISKGKFRRMELAVSNGNQGPYRLTGEMGESFIIMLAGTEKVWLDGQLLERGEEGDYIVDYNLAEIRFTPRRLISSESRVIVEFEYTDQHYTRSLAVYHAAMDSKKRNIYLNVYQERDSKKPAFENDLDSLDKLTLANSGDDQSLLFRSGIKTAGSEFNPNRIYYSYADTTVMIQAAPTAFRILRVKSLPDSSDLQVQFSETPPARGSYRLKSANLNGRVYEWTAPDSVTGLPTGNYEPLVPLIAPQSQLMVTAGLRHNIYSTGLLKAEIAMSRFDQNRLSALDDGDNTGLAGTLELRSPSWKLNAAKTSVQLFTKAEWNDSRFKAINHYRPVEFLRDWNLSNLPSVEDRWITAGLQSDWHKKLELRMQVSQLSRTHIQDGLKSAATLAWRDSIRQIALVLDQLKASSISDRSVFFRPQFSWERRFGKLWTGRLQADREENSRRSLHSDSLLRSAFSFDQIQTSWQRKSGDNKLLNLEYKWRADKTPGVSSFQNFSQAHEALVGFKKVSLRWGNYDLNLTGRLVQYASKALEDSLGQYQFLGSVDHQIDFWKKSIRSKNTYLVSSGVEPKLEFLFEEKRPGEGDYIFVDFNADGIRQQQEYVYAPDIDSAQFIKIQIFNSEYVQVYQSEWNNFLRWDGAQLFQSHKNPIRRLQIENVMRLNSKVGDQSNFGERIYPLQFLDKSSQTIAFTAFAQQQIFFNRSSPKYEYNYIQQYSGHKQLLVSGTEQRQSWEQTFKVRYTLKKKWDLALSTGLKREEHELASYPLQNYQIRLYRIEPSLSFRLSSEVRMQCSYLKKDAGEYKFSGERANINQGAAEVQYAWKRRISLRANTKWISISYSGSPGTVVEYILLEGFKAGNNFTWELQTDYRITKVVQLQLSYSGRKSADYEPTHTMRAAMRANF